MVRLLLGGQCTFLNEGKPDQLRFLWKTDFKPEGDAKKNIRLKWMAICLNMDYVSGKVTISNDSDS
jgi:hypothetical protein